MKLTDDQQAALTTIRTGLSTEALPNYRVALERVAEARAFWKGNQLGWWEDSINAWVEVSLQRRPEASADEEIYDYVVNLYQANGMVILSAQCAAGPPGTRFLPEDPREQNDVDASEQAQVILDYLDRQPWFSKLKVWLQLHQLFYDDGLAVAYVRHIRDARFGTATKDIIEGGPKELKPAQYLCSSCGIEAAETNAVCPNCRVPLGPNDFVPAVVAENVAQVVGQEEVPNGRELVDLYGVLETRLPWWTDKREECPYIGIETEVHVAQLRSLFDKDDPELAQKIQPAYGIDSPSQAGVIAREQVKAPPGVGQWLGRGTRGEMVTYSRWWYRPELFSMVRDEPLRNFLYQTFPKGCRVEWAGPQFLDAEPECLDDVIALGHALTGSGMYKPGVGTSFLDVQVMVNDAVNIGQEAMEKSAIPPIYRDSGLLTSDAVRKRARPGEDVPVPVPPGKNLRDALWQPSWKSTDQSVQQTIQLGLDLGQVLTGAMPALAGQSMENMRTARGYGIARNQAQQRLSVPYEQARDLMRQIDYLRVKQFISNRTESNLAFAEPAEDAVGYAVSVIQLDKAKGNFHVYQETSGQFPATWDQKAGAITSMLQTGNPVIAQLLFAPDNAETTVRAMGVPEIKVPDSDRRKYVRRMIAEIISADQPVAPQSDDFLDDPTVVADEVRRWAYSSEGYRTKRTNPQAYLAVTNLGREALAKLQAIAPPAEKIPTGPLQAQPPRPPAPPPGAEAPSMPEGQGVM